VTPSLSPAASLVRHITETGFPCVGAKAAQARDQIFMLEAGDIRRADDDRHILDFVGRFAARYRAEPALFSSAAVLFLGPAHLSETQFEDALWTRLSSLHRLDAREHPWSDAVSSDPASPHFGFSLAGMAFYVVGLHPGASRSARRLPCPALVFNPHDQFTRLKEMGKYGGIREKILARDSALDGSPNPMLAEHGKVSEAPQYSGRRVEADWRCPFRAV
jgi:hypothetical protein